MMAIHWQCCICTVTGFGAALISARTLPHVIVDRNRLSELVANNDNGDRLLDFLDLWAGSQEMQLHRQ